MAEATMPEAPQSAPDTQPDLHIVTNEAASVDKPMGVVVPAPENTKPTNPAPEAFTDTGYSSNVINTPEAKTEPKPVGPEAMPQAKAPEAQRSVLDSTVSPASIAPDGRSEKEIAAAKAALDKHVAETNAASPKPFSEHGYPDSVLKEGNTNAASDQSVATPGVASEPTPSPTPDQTTTTSNMSQPNVSTTTTEVKPQQKTLLQKLQFWKN
jgi:hypothetical protein